VRFAMFMFIGENNFQAIYTSQGWNRERERAVVPYLWQTSLAAKQLELML
jgi:hypothetical protein